MKSDCVDKNKRNLNIYVSVVVVMVLLWDD